MRLLTEIRNYMGNYHVKSAVYHYHRNEFRQAIGFLQKALADSSSLTEGDVKNARHYLALSHHGFALRLDSTGEVEQAIEQLDLALTIDDYPDLHFRRAEMSRKLGRDDDAVDSYREAVSRQPEYLEAQIALAYCLANCGRTEQAASEFERALKIKTDRFQATFDQGLKLLQSGAAEQGIEAMDAVFLAAPYLAEKHQKNAMDSMRAEEYDQALVDLELAIKLNPKYPDLQNLAGLVYYELQRYEESIESFRRSSALRPAYLVPRLNLAFALFEAGDAAACIAELEEVLQIEPTDPVATAKLAEIRTVEVRDVSVRGASQ